MKVLTLEKVIQELEYKLDINIINKSYTKATKHLQVNQLMKEKKVIEHNIKE